MADSSAEQRQTLQHASLPSLIVVLPLEGVACAYLDCLNDGDERRLILDIEGRDLLWETLDALLRLFEALDEADRGAA